MFLFSSILLKNIFLNQIDYKVLMNNKYSNKLIKSSNWHKI